MPSHNSPNGAWHRMLPRRLASIAAEIQRANPWFRVRRQMVLVELVRLSALVALMVLRARCKLVLVELALLVLIVLVLQMALRAGRNTAQVVLASTMALVEFMVLMALAVLMALWASFKVVLVVWISTARESGWGQGLST